MYEEHKITESWNEIIENFFKQKKETDEVKYLKEVIKSLNTDFDKVSYYGDQDLKDFFDTKKNKKTKEQTNLEFQHIKALKILRLKTKPDSINVKEIINDYRNKSRNIFEKYNPRIWITKAAANATSVSFATHVSKLTHSKINSPSIYDSIDSKDNRYLTTSVLKDKIIDGAVAGNQFAPIFQFLELERNGIKLVSKFADSSNEVLREFASDNNELELWNYSFKKALLAKDKSSHLLAKQIYFPIDDEQKVKDKEYHLLCHLKSSSLAHAIFMSFPDNKRRKFQKDIVAKGKYSDKIIFSLFNKGKISVTASNHSNASQLNGKRGGKLYLLNSQPPNWESQLKSPVNKKSLFDYFFPTAIKEDITYLRDFLIRNDRIELSIKDPKKSVWIEKWVNSIIEEVFYYISTIQNLPAGWSSQKNVKLKKEHKYLLDPYNDDKQFQGLRKEIGWQKIVCKDFANWLNNKLKGRDKKFTPQKLHTRLWLKLFEKPIREDVEEITWDIKNKEKKS